MKLQILFCYLILSSASIFAQSGQLQITVEGVKSTKGNIVFGLYNKAAGFAADNTAVNGAVVKVKSSSVTYVFKNLPASDYAIAVYHDKNGDRKLNTNLVGYPKENYGFSNNAFGLFGTVPKFEEAKVKVGEGQTKNITIILR